MSAFQVEITYSYAASRREETMDKVELSLQSIK
jgi:hypothetical protein